MPVTQACQEINSAMQGGLPGELVALKPLIRRMRYAALLPSAVTRMSLIYGSVTT